MPPPPPDRAPLASFLDVLSIVVNVNDDVSRLLSDTDLAVLRVTCKAARVVVDVVRMRRHAARCTAILGGMPDALLPKLLIGGDANDRRWQVLLSVLPAEDVANDRTLLKLVGRAPLPARLAGARRPTPRAAPSAFQRAMFTLEGLNMSKRAALLLATRAARHGASYAALRPLLLAVRLVMKPSASKVSGGDVSGCACLGSTVGGLCVYERPPAPRSMAQRVQYFQRMWELDVLHFRPVHGEALFCHLLFHGHDIPPRLLNVALGVGPHVQVLLPYAKAAAVQRQERLEARRLQLECEGELSAQALVDQLRAEGLLRHSRAVESVLTRANVVLTQSQRLTARVRAYALLGRVDVLAHLLGQLRDNYWVLMSVSDGATTPLAIPLLPETSMCTLALPLSQKTTSPSMLVVAAEMAMVAEEWRSTSGGPAAVVRRLMTRTCRRGIPLTPATVLAVSSAVNPLRWVEGCLSAWPAAVPPLLEKMYASAAEAVGADDDGRALRLTDATLRTVLAATDPSLGDDGGRCPPALRLDYLAARLPWFGPLLMAPPHVQPSRFSHIYCDSLLVALLATPPRLAFVAWLVREGGAVPVLAVRMQPHLLLPLVAARPHAFAGARMAARNATEAETWNAHVMSALTMEELTAYRDAVSASAAAAVGADVQHDNGGAPAAKRAAVRV